MNVVILHFSFLTMRHTRLVKRFYRSKKGRICFGWGPGHNGMHYRGASQFVLEKDQAYMVTYDTGDVDYYMDVAHFNRCVSRVLSNRLKNAQKPKISALVTRLDAPI